MTAALEASYAHCREIARSRARNFYYSFLLLTRERRDAICAAYAFNRACDDLSDEPGSTRAALERWRTDLDSALEGRYPEDPLWPAFHDTVRRYAIPREYFYEMIEGVAADLEPRAMRDFSELYRYCYQVASVVGMTVIHIFGFDRPEAIRLAEKCGVAFQLTNILRDVREDAERGRVYLPTEDLERFGVRLEDLRDGRRSGEFTVMMRFEASRARSYYEESRPLLGMVERGSRPALAALIGIYWRLLERIEACDYDVLSQRVSLPAWEKLGVLAAALAGSLGWCRLKPSAS